MAGESGFETVIGLEIHVQLDTSSKMFCGCATSFGAPPNTNVCPVCLGLPGALPVVNPDGVELAVRAALGLGCEVRERSVFARKNYFYPDLPKGYQITQYEEPLAVFGKMEFGGDDGPPAVVRIRRLHLEEDAGKSLHDRFPGLTAVDLNRAGVPLVEIVTEPDLRSASAARTFLLLLKQTLEYLEVSDCSMEQGSLRVDANVSVRHRAGGARGVRTEVKNMNSFSQLEKALEFEAARHLRVLERGDEVRHETMLWDPIRGEARPMRGKEEIHDYRYFPEPDLATLSVSADTVTRIAAELPELPWEKRRRLQAEYGLPAYDSALLSSTRVLSDYYEALVRAGVGAKTASNWLMGEVMAVANERSRTVVELELEPLRLAALIRLVEEGALSRGLGKRVLERMVDTGRAAERVLAEEGLRQVGDPQRIESWIGEVMAEHAAEVDRYRAGEERLLGYLMGQVMRKSGGRADPAQVRQSLRKALDRRPGGTA
jgi:aspartyl-tRNA(Asn)/glutamyl-tRNA(Gln) amidotransferase subunit B